MSLLPRLALGTAQADGDLQPMLWALLEVLRRLHVEPQVFQSRCCFSPVDAPRVVLGRCQWHLDSWVMRPDLCREVFVQGARTHDLALVIGQFEAAKRPADTPSATDAQRRGGSLETLCDWLGVPRIVVLDVARLGGCQLPSLPDRTRGVLLDRVADAAALARWQVLLEMHYGLPVLGALGPLPSVRDSIGPWSLHPRAVRETCRLLGDNLSRTLRLDALLRIAQDVAQCSCPDSVATNHHYGSSKVAFAWDEAFNCYFPDTLDLLECNGAKLYDFSLLKSERLPPDIDLVWIGCGHPERHASRLQANVCIRQAIRRFARGGGRIYAEGGGLAYLCEQMHVGERSYRLGEVLSADAYWQPEQAVAAEAELVCHSWLGQPGEKLRGYANPLWKLRPGPGAIPIAHSPQIEHAIIAQNHVLGSRLHLHFSSFPHILAHLLATSSTGNISRSG